MIRTLQVTALILQGVAAQEGGSGSWEPLPAVNTSFDVGGDLETESASWDGNDLIEEPPPYDGECHAVYEGVCTSCEGPQQTECTDVVCNTNFFNFNNDTSDGCEATCVAGLPSASCTACTGPEPHECDQLGECDDNFFNDDNEAFNGCEAGCSKNIANGACIECTSSAAAGCTHVDCYENYFNVDNDASNGCETGCPAVSGGFCEMCSDAASCDDLGLVCDDNRFNVNNDTSDGCEAGCPSVFAGTCTACSSATMCSYVDCNANRFNEDNDATNGCEVGCPSVAQGTCTSCADSSTCTSVDCAAGWNDANDDATDGCEQPIQCDGTNSQCACGDDHAIAQVSGSNVFTCVPCSLGYYASADVVPRTTTRSCTPNVCTSSQDASQLGYDLTNVDCAGTTTGSITCATQPICAAGYNAVDAIVDSDHICETNGGNLTYGGCTYTYQCDGTNAFCVCGADVPIVTSSNGNLTCGDTCPDGYGRTADTLPQTTPATCSLTSCDGSNQVCGCGIDEAVVSGDDGMLSCATCAAGYFRSADEAPVSTEQACSVVICDGTNALCGCGENTPVVQNGAMLSCSAEPCSSGYVRSADVTPITQASGCLVKQCDGTNAECGCGANQRVIEDENGLLSCSSCPTGYERDPDVAPVTSAQQCNLIICDGSNGACGCQIGEEVVATGVNRLDCGTCAEGFTRDADVSPVSSPQQCGVVQCDGSNNLCGCGENVAIVSVGGSLECDSTSCQAGFTRSADIFPRAFAAPCIANPCTSTQIPNSDRWALSSIAGVTDDVVNVVCDAGYSGGGSFQCGAEGEFEGTPCTANTCTLPVEQQGYDIGEVQCDAVSLTTGTLDCTEGVTCAAGYSGEPTNSEHTCEADGQPLTLGGCVPLLCGSFDLCPEGQAIVDPQALQTANPISACCASDCATAFQSECANGTHPLPPTSTSGSTQDECCTPDITSQCRGNTISGWMSDAEYEPAIDDVVCDPGTHPVADPAALRTSGPDPTSSANKDACCEADIVDQCAGNTVSGIMGENAALPDITCGPGRSPKPGNTIGRDIASCCDEVDECATPPNCGGDGTQCIDVPAPQTGYVCGCTEGYIGAEVLDGPTSCLPKPCDANPVVANINGAATQCAGTVSGNTCTVVCKAGYTASGTALCTRGSYSQVSCDQVYEWVVSISNADFTTCATDCGTEEETRSRNVTCTGMGDGTISTDTASCAEAKPATYHTCPAVTIGDECDDGDAETMGDVCVSATVCEGKKSVTTKANFPLPASEWVQSNATEKASFKASVCNQTVEAAQSAGMVSLQTSDCSVPTVVAGSLVTGVNLQSDPDEVTTDVATDMTSNMATTLSDVELAGVTAGTPTVEPVMVYSFVMTAATCPVCDPVMCSAGCDQPASTLPDTYACYGGEVGATPSPVLDSTCEENGVFKPTSDTTCEATPACIQYAWYAPNFPACPSECGTNSSVLQREVVCQGDDGSTTNDLTRCTGVQPSSEFSCPDVVCLTYAWHTDAWTGVCDTAEAMQSRAVTCMGSDGQQVLAGTETLRCGDMPDSTRQCSYSWQTPGPWVPLQCPAGCGHGPSNRTRTVTCADGSGNVVQSSLCTIPMAPSSIDFCTSAPCPNCTDAVCASANVQLKPTNLLPTTCASDDCTETECCVASLVDREEQVSGAYGAEFVLGLLSLAVASSLLAL